MTTASGSSTTLQMLAESEGGTALQAMNAVRYHTAPPGPIFVTQLDEALAPHRSSTQCSTLQRGDFIEIVGPSGSGKTTFINFLLLTSLLPYSLPLPLPSSSTPHHIPLGGKSQSCALLYSASSASPIPSLSRAIRSHIRSSVSGIVSTVGPARLSPAMERAIDNCVSESLGRLRVIRVKSRYRYWALALRALSYPLRMSDEDGKGPDEGMESLGLICLDGLSNCFWPEKYSEEEKSSGTGKKRGMGILGVKGIEDIGMRDIMVTIGNLRKELGCVIFSTTQGLWNEKKGDTSQLTPFFASYLPAPYPSPWSIRPGESADESSTSTHSVPNQRNQPESTHWPMTFQLVLLGRSRGLQYPTDITLGDALHARDRDLARGGGGSDKYMGRVRMRGVEGRLGGRNGVEWGFGMGEEGLEVLGD